MAGNPGGGFLPVRHRPLAGPPCTKPALFVEKAIKRTLSFRGDESVFPGEAEAPESTNSAIKAICFVSSSGPANHVFVSTKESPV
jgi:hypothetical protein